MGKLQRLLTKGDPEKTDRALRVIYDDFRELEDEVETLAPPGVICVWPVATPPKGWLLCDGSAVSRVAFPDLFKAIGTTYGVGDGSTTFNVPDFVNRFPRPSGTPGELGGNNTHGHTAPAGSPSVSRDSGGHTVSSSGHTHVLANTNTSWPNYLRVGGWIIRT